jgi:hypothetical protein
VDEAGHYHEVGEAQRGHGVVAEQLLHKTVVAAHVAHSDLHVIQKAGRACGGVGWDLRHREITTTKTPAMTK